MRIIIDNEAKTGMFKDKFVIKLGDKIITCGSPKQATLIVTSLIEKEAEKEGMKKVPENFIFYSDAGHAWMKVPLQLLVDLKIAKEISTHSYIHDGHAYLEEDRDASIFVRTMKEAGNKINITERHTNKESMVRSYTPYVYYKGE